jgi:hypothetical protein
VDSFVSGSKLLNYYEELTKLILFVIILVLMPEADSSDINKSERRRIWPAVVGSVAFTLLVGYAMYDRAPEDADAPPEPDRPAACAIIIGDATLKLDGHLTANGVYQAIDLGRHCPSGPIYAAITNDKRNEGLTIGYLTDTDDIGKELFVPGLTGSPETTTTQS